MKLPELPLSMSSGAERVVRRLYALGVRCVFSLPGSQVLPLWDALAELPDLRLVVARSERSAAFYGEGYGRAAGAPAVVMNTLGPGVANEPLGMASALSGGAPVLFLSPAQPPAKRARVAEVFQGLDHARFFEGSCKGTVLVDEDARLLDAVEAAYRTCLEAPRGPTRLDVSFPLLFRKRLLSGGGAAPVRPPATPSRPIFVVERSTSAEPLRSSLGLEAFELAAPGIGEPGFALPFGFGARLATRAPVVVLSEPRWLLANLDTLAVAQLAGVPVRLVTAPGQAGSAPSCFGATVLRAETEEALRRLIQGGAEQLTVVLDDSHSRTSS